ncbi:MAG: hypothetical protein LBQ92_03250 [Propionibacteriaceae bacterium]|nr:hypothetical protein [Propionibacteriaceae bacterium]
MLRKKAKNMTAEAFETLTKANRCDRCGAQAYVRVVLPTGGELYFCAHHNKAHEEKLRQAALRIHDESARVDEEAAL